MKTMKILMPNDKLENREQDPESFFMDIKCYGCHFITTPVSSHTQDLVTCANCRSMLCIPTGGRAKVTEGCSYRRKLD